MRRQHSSVSEFPLKATPSPSSAVGSPKEDDGAERQALQKELIDVHRELQRTMAENEVLKVGFSALALRRTQQEPHTQPASRRAPPQELYRELRDSSRDKGDYARVKREYLALQEDYKLARTLAAEMEKAKEVLEVRLKTVMLEKDEVAGRSATPGRNSTPRRVPNGGDSERGLREQLLQTTGAAAASLHQLRFEGVEREKGDLKRQRDTAVAERDTALAERVMRVYMM